MFQRNTEPPVSSREQKTTINNCTKKNTHTTLPESRSKQSGVSSNSKQATPPRLSFVLGCVRLEEESMSSQFTTTKMRPGFDPNVWGRTGWNILYELAFCVDGFPHYQETDTVSNPTKTEERLWMFRNVVMLYSQILPCEPCRLNFTYAIYAYIRQRLHAHLESPPLHLYKHLIDLIREVNFDVKVKQVAAAVAAAANVTGGGKVRADEIPQPGTNDALIRELEIVGTTSESSIRIADFFCMMAAQVDCNHKKTDLRFKSLLNFLEHCAYLYAQSRNPIREDLASAISQGLKRVSHPPREEEEDDTFDYSGVAKRVAYTIRMSLRDGVLPIDENTYFDHLDKLRGPATTTAAVAISRFDDGPTRDTREEHSHLDWDQSRYVGPWDFVPQTDHRGAAPTAPLVVGGWPPATGLSPASWADLQGRGNGGYGH